MEKPAKQPKDRNAGTHWILRMTTKDPLKPPSHNLRHYKREEGRNKSPKAMSKAHNSEKQKDRTKRTQQSQSTFLPAPSKHAKRGPLSLIEKSKLQESKDSQTRSRETIKQQKPRKDPAEERDRKSTMQTRNSHRRTERHEDKQKKIELCWTGQP